MLAVSRILLLLLLRGLSDDRTRASEILLPLLVSIVEDECVATTCETLRQLIGVE
jgi:hypothetical protein